MVTSANITPQAGTDGITYCTAVPITTSEADLADSLKTPDPIAIEYGQTIVAIVQLSINGIITANSTYIVMQADLGDGVWVDVSWFFFQQTQGSATFIMWGGGSPISATPVQNSRLIGSAPNPQSNAGRVFPLAGRIRFTGQTTMSAGSSSAPGVTTQVTATIKYKLLTPR